MFERGSPFKYRSVHDSPKCRVFKLQVRGIAEEVPVLFVCDGNLAKGGRKKYIQRQPLRLKMESAEQRKTPNRQHNR